MNPFELLPPAINPEIVIAAMAGIAVLLMFSAMWLAFTPRDPLAARAKALTARRDSLKAAALAPKQRAKAVASTTTFMQDVVTKLNLLRGSGASAMKVKLSQAGYRSKEALITYLFAKFVMPFVGGGLAVFFLYGVRVYDGPQLTIMAMTIGAVFIGLFAPDVFVKNSAAKRQHALRKAMPDGLDLMVICAEAGLSLDATLMRVSNELGKGYPELSDELSLTSVELGFLPERKTALTNFATRTDLPHTRALVNTLMQTERYGTPLAQSLRVLSAEMRHERTMRAEEKAARLPATLTVPMIIFILPPLFIVLIGPAILKSIDGLSGI
ncbi:MAG: type II secretion system F family protein [Pseudomonadota bacterium]